MPDPTVAEARRRARNVLGLRMFTGKRTIGARQSLLREVLLELCKALDHEDEEQRKLMAGFDPQDIAMWEKERNHG